MSALSPRAEAVVLPSIPPSPSLLDEVFGQPRPWSVRLEESDLRASHQLSLGSVGSRSRKNGKEASDDEDERTQHGVRVQEAYPPMNDEAAETRRVEETLKRWELAERQRRKSVRESTQNTSGPSLLTSVTRTASLVLSRRSRAGSTGVSVGTNNTHVFKSHEAVDVSREGYAVPLDDIDHHAHTSRVDVAVHSPSHSPSLFDRSASVSLDAGTRVGSGSSGTSENPFVHPSERVRTPPPLLVPLTPTRTLPPSTPSSPTPFSDTHAQQGGTTDLTMRARAESRAHTRKRSSGGRISIISLPPPVPPKPRPLGLPPPSQDAPRAAPLQPTSQPVLRPLRREDQEDREVVRWWHDWLCGCGEGPDRGGDSQAGRTNPFE